MIDLPAIDWRRDIRRKAPEFYVVPLDDVRNRLNAFMSGWHAHLNDSGSMAKTITWRNLGRLFATILGNIPLEQRRAVYAVLLHQYVHSPRTKSWTDEDRATALSYFVNNL